MRPLISLSKRFWACKQTRGPLRSGPGRSTTPTPTPAPQRGSAPGSRLSCTDSPRNFPPKPRRKRSPIYDTTLGFAHGTTLSGTSEPARRERSPAGADAAAGAGGTRRRGQGFAARHRGGGGGGSSAGERRSAARPVPRQAAPEPDAAPAPLTRMPITSAHSWANASDVPLSAGAAGPPARSPSMPRPGRRINAGSPPPPPARPAPPCLARPARLPARPGPSLPPPPPPP